MTGSTFKSFRNSELLGDAMPTIEVSEEVMAAIQKILEDQRYNSLEEVLMDAIALLIEDLYSEVKRKEDIPKEVLDFLTTVVARHYGGTGNCPCRVCKFYRRL